MGACLFSRMDSEMDIAEEETEHDVVEQDSRVWRTEIPNIVFGLGLSVYEKVLYLHLKQTAGQAGRCWKSTATLAAESGMSMASISEAKKGLAEKRKELGGKPLIIIKQEKQQGGGKARHIITIVDIWEKNIAFYRLKKATGNRGKTTSHSEIGTSHSEIKNKPSLRINAIKEEDSPSYSSPQGTNKNQGESFQNLNQEGEHTGDLFGDDPATQPVLPPAVPTGYELYIAAVSSFQPGLKLMKKTQDTLNRRCHELGVDDFTKSLKVFTSESYFREKDCPIQMFIKIDILELAARYNPATHTGLYKSAAKELTAPPDEWVFHTRTDVYKSKFLNKRERLGIALALDKNGMKPVLYSRDGRLQDLKTGRSLIPSASSVDTAELATRQSGTPILISTSH